METLFNHAHFPADRARRLNDPERLKRHLSEADLLRLLALTGNEDVADLGSGTGFYTDIVARHTTGTVYAVDLAPQMHDAHVRCVRDPGDPRRPQRNIEVFKIHEITAVEAPEALEDLAPEKHEAPAHYFRVPYDCVISDVPHFIA